MEEGPQLFIAGGRAGGRWAGGQAGERAGGQGGRAGRGLGRDVWAVDLIQRPTQRQHMMRCQRGQAQHHSPPYIYMLDSF